MLIIQISFSNNMETGEGIKEFSYKLVNPPVLMFIVLHALAE